MYCFAGLLCMWYDPSRPSTGEKKEFSVNRHFCILVVTVYYQHRGRTDSHRTSERPFGFFFQTNSWTHQAITTLPCITRWVSLQEGSKLCLWRRLVNRRTVEQTDMHWVNCLLEQAGWIEQVIVALRQWFWSQQPPLSHHFSQYLASTQNLLG